MAFRRALINRTPIAAYDAPKRLPYVELPSLQVIPDADQRLYLRMYLRSNIDSDQEIARVRCEKWGIDYQTAREEARRS